MMQGFDLPSARLSAQAIPPHILVVDDDREIRDLLARFLERESFHVTTVRDAAEARKALSQSQFQLVVLDLMLPGESGLEFARALRSQSDIPIVMLTASSGSNSAPMTISPNPSIRVNCSPGSAR